MITMAGLLLVMGAVEQTYGTGSFKKLSGLAGREKWASVLMVLGLFSSSVCRRPRACGGRSA